MTYYRHAPKRKRPSIIAGIFKILLMVLFGVIHEQTKDTLR